MSAGAAEVGRQLICTDGWRVTIHVEVRRGPLHGPEVSARDLPTGCQQQCFSGSPHSTRASISDRTSAKSPQNQPTKRPEREGLAALSAFGALSLPGACGCCPARSHFHPQSPIALAANVDARPPTQREPVLSGATQLRRCHANSLERGLRWSAAIGEMDERPKTHPGLSIGPGSARADHLV
jgi:hypothetical protein